MSDLPATRSYLDKSRTITFRCVRTGRNLVSVGLATNSERGDYEQP